ncbi:carbonic anhydrase [Nocardia sp. NPDC005978]|uniref:carbonic anhydrase n=1 Tax=Nocardia sp. NPDC005978 TaxID=3156725 RepID=UPI0033A4E381
MNNLSEGVQRFQHEIFPGKAELFERLAGAHHPGALFIGCSDARVVPELITSADAGDLFVIRTAGNLVPAYSPAEIGGVTASIEYAVSVLGVSDIVVCGHSACGAMTALAQDHDLSAVPAVARWLRHADPAMARMRSHGGAPSVQELVRHNVAAQLANLATHPSVAAARIERDLTLHGWVFDIPTGAIDPIAA